MDGLRHLGLLLKLRLVLVWRDIFASAASTAGSIIALVIVAPISIVLGLVLWYVITSMSRLGQDPLSITRFVLIVVYLFWLQAAIRGYLGNEFFDTTRIAHLPINPLVSFGATIIGGLLGFGTLFAAPLIAGLSIGLNPSPYLVLARLLFYFPLLLLHLVVVPRVLSYGIEWLSGFRVVREWGIVAGFVAFTAIWIGFLYLLYRPGGFQMLPSIWQNIEPYFVLLPPVWFADSFGSLESGRFETHIPFLLIFLPLTFLCLVVSGVLHVRLSISEASRGTLGRSRLMKNGGVGVLDDAMLHFRPLAYAWLHIRTVWRDPVIRARVLSSALAVVAPIAILFFISSYGRFTASYLKYAPYFLTFILVNSQRLFMSNILGVDGPAVSTLFVHPAPRRWMLLGKNLAAIGLHFLVDVPFVAVICVLFRSPEAIPVCLAGALVFLVLYSGLGNIFSVLLPIPLSVKGSNALRQTQRNRRGCKQSMVYFLTVLVSTVIAGPFIIAFGVSLAAKDTLPMAVLLPVAGILAVIVYVICLIVAESLLEGREEQIIDSLTRANE